MTQLRISRVLALPAAGQLTPSTMYIVQGPGATEAQVYFTNNDASAVRHVPTLAEIDQKIQTAIDAFSDMQVVADIAARNALTLTRTSLVLVLDATGDPTVHTGSALYVYDFAHTTWYKVSEYESLDLTLTWDAIQGKPTSTPAQIDDAVSKAHTHANKTVLDDLTDVNGQLAYKGAPVANVLDAAEW